MAEKYRPKPNIKCVLKLLSRADLGEGVWLAAIPKPRQGCIKKKGKMTVEIPKRSAENSLGDKNQCVPTIMINSALKIMPIT